MGEKREHREETVCDLELRQQINSQVSQRNLDHNYVLNGFRFIYLFQIAHLIDGVFLYLWYLKWIGGVDYYGSLLSSD